MIKELKIKNFKSFIDCSLQLLPLTVLTGMNASGKSSVIQAIRMVKMRYESAGGDFALHGHSNPSLLKSKLSKDDNFFISLRENNKYFSLNAEILNLGIYNYGYDDIELEKRNKLNHISYISADRYGPNNDLPVSHDENLNSVGDLGQYVISFIEKNKYTEVPEILRLNLEHKNLMSNINDWLSVISPNTVLEYDYVTTSETVSPKYNGIAPTETGYGLSFTLPVITMLLYSKFNDVLLLENPEAHLHPAAQTQIGQLIARAVSVGKQVIVETHSDHIIDGIRIAAKKNLINATDVAFLFFEKTSFESETTVQPLTLYQDGKISFWPDGFFDQSLIDKAIIARKNNE